MARSVYNYILPSELPQFIHKMSSVTNEDLAVRFISDAERIIDAYVGPGPKFYPDLTGTLTSGVASGATAFPADIWGRRRPNYWAQGGAYVRIVRAIGAEAAVGQERLVVSSPNETESVTLASGFDVALPAGAEFEFSQESAFPRFWDQNPFASPTLPQLLKAAVAAQVEYGIFFGSEEFGLGDPTIVTDEKGDVISRTYGSGYSESRDARRRDGLSVWIAPKARVLLRKLMSNTGYMRS